MYNQARTLIDAAHANDPNHSSDGRPAELVYADHMEQWVRRLVPDAKPILLLAARCQHLERWKTPRNTFPATRPGYLAWRRSLYGKQAARARELLLQAGVSQEEADAAAEWIAKTGGPSNAGTQTLEDAAVLVFLENEIGNFMQQHTDYPREKFIHILRKSWAKLSPRAQEAARELDLPPAIAELVREAVADRKG